MGSQSATSAPVRYSHARNSSEAHNFDNNGNGKVNQDEVVLEDYD